MAEAFCWRHNGALERKTSRYVLNGRYALLRCRTQSSQTIARFPNAAVTRKTICSSVLRRERQEYVLSNALPRLHLHPHRRRHIRRIRCRDLSRQGRHMVEGPARRRSDTGGLQTRSGQGPGLLQWASGGLATVAPNPAHRALARLEADYAGTVTLVTQNIDDLHERAGCRDVIHMHGELRLAFCAACGAKGEAPETLSPEDACSHCGSVGTMRPDVVWFGEMPYHLDRITEALSAADLFVSIGTSGAVYPAAGFVAEARRAQSGADRRQLSVRRGPSRPCERPGPGLCRRGSRRPLGLKRPGG